MGRGRGWGRIIVTSDISDTNMDLLSPSYSANPPWIMSIIPPPSPTPFFFLPFFLFPCLFYPLHIPFFPFHSVPFLSFSFILFFVIFCFVYSSLHVHFIFIFIYTILHFFICVYSFIPSFCFFLLFIVYLFSLLPSSFSLQLYIFLYSLLTDTHSQIHTIYKHTHNYYLY